MAEINKVAEIVLAHETDEVLAWMESELKSMRQIALSKEADKSFSLGRISTGLNEVSMALGVLRTKLKPQENGKPPVVAG